MAENEICARVREAVADVLDGSAPDELFDHIVDCDACRDLRHDAERAAREARHAGDGYHVPADLEARVLGALPELQTPGPEPKLAQTEAMAAPPSAEDSDSKNEANEPLAPPKPDSKQAPRAVARRAMVAAFAVAAV